MGLALIVPGISFSGANIGRVTPAEDIPITGLAISGPSTITGGADAAQFIAEYTPSTTSQRAVTWSIVSGSSYASISASGVLSVLQGATSAAVTIRVTSSVNPSIYAEKAITVTYSAQPGALPDGAIAADFIYSTGYSSFIDTDIVPTARMSYEMDLVWVNDTALATPFGYYIGGVRYAFCRETQDEIQYGGYYMGEYPDSLLPFQRTKIRLVMTESGATVETYTPDGTLLNSESITYSESQEFAHAIGLLGRKTSDTAIGAGSWRGGIGRFKVYGDANFDTLVADFIPCFYQNNFGFWDAVAGEFLTGNVPADIFGFGAAWGTQGFSPNTINSPTSANPEYLVGYRDYDTTRMFEIPSSCANIRFNIGEINAREVLMFFDGNGTYIDYYSANVSDREIPVPAGATYVRLSYRRMGKASSYIYDMTNGAYIWNGGA